MSSEVRRKLTTILAADAEGYSREMEADEVRALAALQAARQIFSKFIERHHGRVANTAGDGLIAEFPSVVEAVQCAIEVQSELNGAHGEPGGALRFRIGIHLGDVIVDGNDLLGEGVNLAARLQAMAEPGGILISQQVYDQVHAKLSVGFEYLGGRRPRNYSNDVAVYRVQDGKIRRMGREDAGAPPRGKWHRPPAAAPAAPAPPAGDSGDGGGRERWWRHARILGVVFAALLAIDLLTGPTFWAFWPGMAFATVLGLEAAPLIARGWATVALLRGAVIIGLLVAINAVIWTGHLWVIWPAGAILVLAVLRRVAARPH